MCLHREFIYNDYNTSILGILCLYNLIHVYIFEKKDYLCKMHAIIYFFFLFNVVVSFVGRCLCAVLFNEKEILSVFIFYIYISCFFMMWGEHKEIMTPMREIRWENCGVVMLCQND